MLVVQTFSVSDFKHDSDVGEHITRNLLLHHVVLFLLSKHFTGLRVLIVLQHVTMHYLCSCCSPIELEIYEEHVL